MGSSGSQDGDQKIFGKAGATKHESARRRVTFDTVREIAHTLPGAEESTSYGTPAFKVKGKLFARQHQDGESLVIPVRFDAREEMMNTSPEKFYLTDHYLNYEYVLVRMANVNIAELRDLLTGAWRRVGGQDLGAFNQVKERRTR
jgi:hypothetical protein